MNPHPKKAIQLRVWNSVEDEMEIVELSYEQQIELFHMLSERIDKMNDNGGSNQKMIDSIRTVAEEIAPNRTVEPAGEEVSGGLYTSAMNDLRRSKGY